MFVHAVLFGFEALLFRCPALHLFFYFGKTRVKEKDFSVSFFWLTCAAWSSARRLARIASSSSSPDILFRFVSSLIFFSFPKAFSRDSFGVGRPFVIVFRSLSLSLSLLSVVSLSSSFFQTTAEKKFSRSRRSRRCCSCRGGCSWTGRTSTRRSFCGLQFIGCAEKSVSGEFFFFFFF